MRIRILAVGDVCMESGLKHLEKTLPGLRKLEGIDFCVVNGENANNTGLLPEQAERMHFAGADVVTLGNHSFGTRQVFDLLDDAPWLLRPENFGPKKPGRGCGYFDCRGLRIRVMNLIGRGDLEWNAYESPFLAADRLLKSGEADVTLLDFHAQATSEKIAMGFYLDGRVSAMWGTHTHVPTADEQVFEKGMGYLTDLGMTGPIVSVLGIEPEQSVEHFLGGLPGRYRPGRGGDKLQGAVFEWDSDLKRCTDVHRLDVR